VCKEHHKTYENINFKALTLDKSEREKSAGKKGVAKLGIQRYGCVMPGHEHHSFENNKMKMSCEWSVGRTGQSGETH
jgi:hypothetical protein